MSYIIFPGDPQATRDLVGGKAGALAELQQAGLPVPPWFALTTVAFTDSLTDEQRLAPGGAVAEEARAVLAQVIPSPAVRAALEQALDILCPSGELLAVRSSALEEDGAERSFAGQFDSFLNVHRREVAERVAAVWQSGLGERALAYRAAGRGAPGQLAFTPPAVLVQRMVDAEAAGVAFSADPVSGRRGLAVVAATYGLGKGLVDGACEGDTYAVDRAGQIAHRHIAVKSHACRPARPGATPELVEVPQDLADRPAIDDDVVRAVAALARRVESHAGCPQDIEWAWAQSTLVLLQARPITTLAALPDPDGARTVWDNSNIAESYGGIVTPLTFSFARRAYEEVYRQFCLLLGVPRATVVANQAIFRRMIGLVRGRIYYNLFSWYAMLALLPGYRYNRRFMEQMMGVKERLDEPATAPPRTSGPLGRLAGALALLRPACSLVKAYLRLPTMREAFYTRLGRALDASPAELALLRPDELAAEYRRLEGELLVRWDAPLVNDFFAMISFGLLRSLANRWCGSAGDGLQNDLLCAEGTIVSAEPARRIEAMSAVASRDPHLVEALCEGTLQQALAAVEEAPEIKALYGAYLERFGERCTEELKLESATLHDDPLPLLRAVGRLARRTERPAAERNAAAMVALRKQAEERAGAALRGRPLRTLIFSAVLRGARARVRDRENLRFERTRVFGRARRIFVELGRRYFALGLLDDPRDIFYLEAEEALGYVEGTATCNDLRGLAAVRKLAFARYQEENLPTRFETHGIPDGPALVQRRIGGSAQAERASASALAGTPCCPGVVRGRVRVVGDLRNICLAPGEILAAERTDPGWIMLFPAAAGLLVERGSLLSHAAIVARELGLPAIVGLDGLSEWLQDGDLVEMDGSAGVVRKVGPEGAE